MHINIKNLFSIEPSLLSLLLVAKQAGKKDLSNEIAMLLPEDSVTDKLIEDGYLKLIKGKASQELPEKIRLGKKGTAFLDSLSEVEVDEDDIKIEEWLHNTYSKRPSYQKSNRKQTKRLLAWFKTETGIEKNQLLNLFNCFLNDTFVTETTNKDKFWEEFNEKKEYNKRLQLSNKLENLLWKSDNIYSRKFKLEESSLYSYYTENKTYIDSQYKIFIKSK